MMIECILCDIGECVERGNLAHACTTELCLYCSQSRHPNSYVWSKIFAPEADASDQCLWGSAVLVLGDTWVGIEHEVNIFVGICGVQVPISDG